MVNVKTMKNLEVTIPKTPESIFDELFEHQRNLILRYKEVEDLGQLDGYGHLKSIQTKKHQRTLKEFAWRTTEELMELLEAEGDKEHVLEELADSLHFLIEMCILSGIESKTIRYEAIEMMEEKTRMSLKETILGFVYLLGLSCNVLKNKPWKTSELITDENKYLERLKEAFVSWWNIPVALGTDLNTVYLYYCLKNKVNNFRIDTKY